LFAHLGRSSLPITAVGIGGYFRVYSAAHPHALGYGKNSSRFSDPRTTLVKSRRFGVLYLGSSLKVCFVEAVLRDRAVGLAGTFYLTNTEMRRLNVVELRSTRPLRLVDLRGDNLVKMRLPTDLARAQDHHLGQQASLAFYTHPDKPDGILYRSRLNEGLCVAVYGRAVRRMRGVKAIPLLDDARLAGVLDEYDLGTTR